jgi:hypothetical protein
MKAVQKRVGRLEDRLETALSGKPRIHLRVLVNDFAPGVDLDKSSCRRTLNDAGGLIEIVNLAGSADAISQTELENFIASFPITLSRRTDL